MTTETFKLSRPLKTHSGEVMELTLREPTGGEFVEYGEPYALVDRHDGSGALIGTEFTFTKENNRAMFGFLSRMTGVDDLLLRGISAFDFQRLRVAAGRIIATHVPSADPTEPSSA